MLKRILRSFQTSLGFEQLILKHVGAVGCSEEVIRPLADRLHCRMGRFTVINFVILASQ